MPYICVKCNASFPKNQGLVLHLNRKRPCDQIMAPKVNKCDDCNKWFTRQDTLQRHRRKHCAKRLPNEIVHHYREDVPVIQPEFTTNIINAHTMNVQTNILNVTIAPWGSPLQLTDADVELALSKIPGITDTPDLSEVVATLMELVKRAHLSDSSRNVYLNPKRSDQALACTPAGRWAALPLSEATATLFDGATARIAAPVRVPRNARNTQALRATVPAQYQSERAGAVQMGLRPMEAHLANLVPGGPGPLLITEAAMQSAAPAATPAAAPASAPAAAPLKQGPTHVERLKAAMVQIPIRCSPSGALIADWIALASQTSGLTGRELIVALNDGGADEELAAVRVAARIYIEEKSRPRP
ncbi:MAG: C2H2-type zinc finger protein [Sphingomonadaceae bacterium]|nr:C2H2-type zinc finger protein [Sphingomonadaceae bacterium]